MVTGRPSLGPATPLATRRVLEAGGGADDRCAVEGVEAAVSAASSASVRDRSTAATFGLELADRSEAARSRRRVAATLRAAGYEHVWEDTIGALRQS
jgi:hypothetical protein